MKALLKRVIVDGLVLGGLGTVIFGGWSCYSDQVEIGKIKNERLQGYGVCTLQELAYITGGGYHRHLANAKFVSADGKPFTVQHVCVTREGPFPGGTKFRLSCNWWEVIFAEEIDPPVIE